MNNFNFKSYDNSKQTISYCEVDKCPAVIKLKEQLEAYKMEAEEGKEINAELKAENEELKEKNRQLTILGMDLNQSNEVLRKSFFATDKSRDYWREQAEKHSKTLTEIKEIAKPHQRNIDKICGHCRRYDGCHACCIDDINCYQHKKPTTPACDKYCELKEFEINNIANQILQKISECEVQNGNI